MEKGKIYGKSRRKRQDDIPAEEVSGRVGRKQYLGEALHRKLREVEERIDEGGTVKEGPRW